MNVCTRSCVSTSIDVRCPHARSNIKLLTAATSAVYRYRAQRASTSLAASKLLEREVSVANSAVPAYSNTSKELHAIKESLGSVHVAIMTVAGKAGSARQAAAGLLASEPALPSGDASSSSSVLD